MPSNSNAQQQLDDSSEGGLLELARVFAEGVLRLHRRGELPWGPNGLSIETALKSAAEDLEQSRDSRLSVTRG